ncbi:MAG: V-type ATP synthase subunit A [bacterium]|nr:V-type ATP synthase subunit A [bacterium]
MSSLATVVGVNGNLVKVRFTGQIMQNEIALVHLGDQRLKGEVIRIRGNEAELQIFEDCKDVGQGDSVEFTGDLLSVQLGPGLLGMLFDGLQNPLNRMAAEQGFFTPRGSQIPSLDPEQRWAFTPKAQVGDRLMPGDLLGTVPEGRFEHRIMVPFYLKGPLELKELAAAGEFDLQRPIGRAVDVDGKSHELKLGFRWPVKKPVKIYQERLMPTEPMVTQVRIVDALFPVAKGGTYCIPGPFGAGKTVLQQITSRYAEVDIVIIAACGERANEVVETIKEFPELIDPKTGKSLMERTIIICNTSSMPVAARESSVYTAVTLGEYYRQMGLDVLMLADSTSRWAQALRERSGRLEEIPGEEAFPAYLESTIASFYERAGRVRFKSGDIGSLTIGGTVSPAGGNFEEPVTKATLKVVGAFHGLSRERSDARRYPSIDPLESWSKYPGVISAPRRQKVSKLLHQVFEINQMMKVIGDEGTSTKDYTTYLKGEFFDSVFLQQNAFDEVDAATPKERQETSFSMVELLVEADLNFEDKDSARKFFTGLRQRFIDWNSLPSDSQGYQKKAEEIVWLIQKQGGAHE